MKVHKKQIKKLTLATLGLGFMAMLIAKEMLVDIADQYIEGEFKLMNKTNSTSMTFDVAPTSFWFYGDSQRAQYGEYGDIFTFEGQPFPDQLQPAIDPIYNETEWEVPAETTAMVEKPS